MSIKDKIVEPIQKLCVHPLQFNLTMELFRFCLQIFIISTNVKVKELLVGTSSNSSILLSLERFHYS